MLGLIGERENEKMITRKKWKVKEAAFDVLLLIWIKGMCICVIVCMCMEYTYKTPFNSIPSQS